MQQLNSRLVLLFCAATIVSAASAQSIVSLSGIISNKKGRPVAGAMVRLIGLNLADTTDEQGFFSLSGETAVGGRAPLTPEGEKIALEGGLITMTAKKPCTVRIETYDARGKFISGSTVRLAGTGKYRLPLPAHPSTLGMAFIRVSTEWRTELIRTLAIQKDACHFSHGENFSITITGAIARKTTTVDALKVTAPHYLSVQVPIGSYENIVNIALDTLALDRFSFFVTSLQGLQELSKNVNGFGGDLRFGKTGLGAGLLGADSICQCLAEMSMPGSKVKGWRAFLSAARDGNGNQVNAIDRIGDGPWYDRLGRIVSENKTGLLGVRPAAAQDIMNDLPNEYGVPNHRPDPNKPVVDNHLTVTGSGTNGKLYSSSATCADWTSVVVSGRPRAGFSWPQPTGMKHWISTWDAHGCAAGIDLDSLTFEGRPEEIFIGSGGGYGGFYCFALNP